MRKVVYIRSYRLLAVTKLLFRARPQQLLCVYYLLSLRNYAVTHLTSIPEVGNGTDNGRTQTTKGLAQKIRDK